jgi:Holliday junction resolvase RusA-like endonuclease
VVINAYYSIPKSTSKKDRELIKQGLKKPTKKPDIDNIAKIILDSLNGIAYKDDTQVVSLTVHKIYYGNEPFVDVFIEEAS